MDRKENLVIDLLAQKSLGGNVYINKAKLHLAKHEWGLARLAIEEAMAKGGLDEQHEAETLRKDVDQILWSRPDTASAEVQQPR
jgi:hypothetical protein